MQGKFIDLPSDSAPWLYAVASPPTTANEWSIYLECLWGANTEKRVCCSHFMLKFDAELWALWASDKCVKKLSNRTKER